MFDNSVLPNKERARDRADANKTGVWVTGNFYCDIKRGLQLEIIVVVS